MAGDDNRVGARKLAQKKPDGFFRTLRAT